MMKSKHESSEWRQQLRRAEEKAQRASFGEKVKVLDQMRKGRNPYAQLAKICNKNESIKLWRRKKNPSQFFPPHLRLQKL